ncbi:YceI family protein [Georgenia faecalis]|uniref:YceI family protein n=1 Tax=Georgenia faecalis TaxID=2483799 RepID=UPI0030BA01F4
MGALDGELAGEWVFDPAHSRFGFSARHAMVTRVRGAFNDVEGRMHVDPDGPAKSFVTVRLRAASVDTRHPQRDAHLRSADFFDVERYPDIVFTSTTIQEAEERMYMVVGDLTIRGITHEVAIPIERVGVERGADGELRVGFEGTRRVDRRAWGLEWQVPLDTGGVLVSERVTMEFEISAVKRPDAPDGTPGADTAPDVADAGDGGRPDADDAPASPADDASTGAAAPDPAAAAPDPATAAPDPATAGAAPAAARGRHRALGARRASWFRPRR